MADTPSAEITASKTPNLGQLGYDTTGVLIGEQILTIHIASLAEFMGGSWNKAQVDECGRSAYPQCFWFNQDELKQFILRVKTGVYSSHKNFSPPVFMEFLKEYTEERRADRYSHYSQLKQPVKLHEDAKPLTDEQMQELKDNIAAIAKQMGEPIRQIVDDKEYQQIKADYYKQQQQAKIKTDIP